MVKVIEKVRVQVFFGNQQHFTIDEFSPQEAEKLMNVDYTKSGAHVFHGANGYFIIPNNKIFGINVTYTKVNGAYVVRGEQN